MLTNRLWLETLSDEEFEEIVGQNTLCDFIQNHDIKHCDKYNTCEYCIRDWLNKDHIEN